MSDQNCTACGERQDEVDFGKVDHFSEMFGESGVSPFLSGGESTTSFPVDRSCDSARTRSKQSNSYEDSIIYSVLVRATSCLHASSQRERRCQVEVRSTPNAYSGSPV